MKQKAGKGSSGGKIRLRSQLVANYPWWPPAPPPFIDFFEKWRIVDLCCVSFRSLPKGFSDTFFIRLFPHISYYKILSRVHCAVCRPLLVIYLICNSVYINPKLLIYPCPTPYPLVTMSLFSMPVSLCFLSALYHSFPPIRDIIWYLSDLLYLERQSLGASRLLQMTLFHSSLWLNDTPWCEGTASSLSVHLLIDI